MAASPCASVERRCGWLQLCVTVIFVWFTGTELVQLIFSVEAGVLRSRVALHQSAGSYCEPWLSVGLSFLIGGSL